MHHHLPLPLLKKALKGELKGDFLSFNLFLFFVFSFQFPSTGYIFHCPGYVMMTTSMKYKAVIFDLGGTLAPSAPWSVYRDMACQVAASISAPIDVFVEKWFSESSGLGLGKYRDYSDYIAHVCRLLRLPVPLETLKSAGKLPIKIDMDYSLKPREHALEVLEYLKAAGYKIGLISDCSPSIPALWPKTEFAPYFDTTVFSCDVGTNKANTDIFTIALKQLKVQANDCVYIADGMRKELTHASALGMKSLQLLIPEERQDNSPIREDWHGATIRSLREIYDLL